MTTRYSEHGRHGLPAAPWISKAGFDCSVYLKSLCEDLVRQIPSLHHIDCSRVGISCNQSRKPGRHGTFASLTPLRFEGGAETGIRRGRPVATQRVVDAHGRELLYLITFYIPRFWNLDARYKLETAIHELWHISPDFDGDIRRYGSRYAAHGPSRSGFDDQVRRLADEYSGNSPNEALMGWLKLSFRELEARCGRVVGSRYKRPKLIYLQ